MYYIYDDQHNPILELDPTKAFEWCDPYRKLVSLTTFPDGTKVSTVFLTLDHGSGWMLAGHLPVLWETMVFDCPHEEWQEFQDRYVSYKDAVIGHMAVVREIMALQDVVELPKPDRLRRIK